MNNKRLFIGIDGGGSNTVAAVVTENGEMLKRFWGDSINYNSIGFEAAKHNLSQIASEIISTYGDYIIDTVFIGCSALDAEAGPETADSFAGDIFKGAKIYLSSDAHAALAGMALGKRGVLVISGTGSIGLAIDDKGEISVAGGWGYAVGDEGSAYNIAVKGINAALNAFDSISEPTLLQELVLNFFNISNPREIITKIYTPYIIRKDIAKFEPEVTKCARKKDSAAVSILHDAANSLSKLAYTLVKKAGGACPVGIYGGVFKHDEILRNNFIMLMEEKCPECKVGFPLLQPEIGAVIEAMKREGLIITDELIELLKYSSNRG